MGIVIDINCSLIKYINDLQTDEEYMRYKNLAISFFSENFEETVNKRIQKRKQFSDDNVKHIVSTSNMHF